MMRKRISFLFAAAVCALGASSKAQDIEVSPFLGLGYTTSGSLDRAAPGVSGLEISGGVTWGGDASWFMTRRLAAGISFARQESRLRLKTEAGSGDLFDLSIGHLHGTLTYQWGASEAKLRPYALVGVGAAFLSAAGFPGETKLSWAVGGGVKYFLSSRAGLKLQARYAPTRLNDADAAPFCDPLGFCSGSLNQGEIFGGLVLRF
jgi:opacity protein-like surface antigen